MADRSVVLRLRAEVGAYKAAMGEATKATDAFGDSANKNSVQASSGLAQVVESASKHEAAWQTVGTSLLGVGTAATAGVGLAVAKYSDFDAAMSAVQASTLESERGMETLREAALAAGADTAFSATEAAGGIEELAKAGVSTADIVGGGLAGALDLAAAGGISVEQAAETAATALTQFKLEGRDVTHIADLLAAGAGKAQGGVGDLGAALGQSGLVASQFGLSIEDTVGTLSAFASAGLIGSDAGTSFKSMLLALANPAGETAALMSDLGIAAYDTEGNFVGVRDLAGQLQDKLGGLTQAQRDQALAQIFGNDAVRAANVLFAEGEEGIAGWIAKTDDAGYAAETAAARTDNLRGDIERLGGAVDTALINLGSGADGPLRTVVGTLESVVDGFGQAPPAVQNTTIALGGVVGVAGLAGGAFLTLAPRILETRSAVNQLATDMPRLTGAARNLAKIGGAAVGIAATATALVQISEATRGDKGGAAGVNATAAALDRLAAERDFSDLDKLFSEGFASDGAFGIGQVGDEIDSLDEAFRRTFSKSTSENVEDFFGGIGTAMGSTADVAYQLQQQYRSYDDALAAMVTGGNLEGAQAAFTELSERAVAQGASVEEAQALFPGYQDAVIGATEAAAEAAVATGEAAAATDGLAGSVGGVTPAIESTFSSLESYAAALGYDQEQTDALRDSTSELGESMLGFVDPLGTYTGYLDAKIAKEQEASGQTDATGAAGQEAWRQFVDGAGIAFDQYLADLEKQVEDQANWQMNMLSLAGRVSQGTIDELARMGPEGAPLVAELVDRSDAELDRFDTVAQARSKEATDAWGAQLTLAIPVLAEIAKTAGADTVAALAAELQSGKRTVADIAAEYGVELAGGVNPVLKSLGKPTIRAQRQAAGRGLQEYADGGWWDSTFGAQQPQIQHNHGDEGVKWAETGAGPWEAFISGHPSKRTRSRSIWEETGRRLGVLGPKRTSGPDDVSSEAYADGGFWSPDEVKKPPSSAPFQPPISSVTDAVVGRAYDEVKAWVKANASTFIGPDGEPVVVPAGGGRDLVSIGRLLQSMGARVSEHPAFGGVNGRHSPTSLHYKGRAIDVNYGGGGANAAENTFMRAVIPQLRKMANFRQLYFREIGGRTDHDDHLHLGLADGGVLDQRKGSLLNPHVRDQGGPLLEGYTLNATGGPEMVIPAQPFALPTQRTGQEGRPATVLNVTQHITSPDAYDAARRAAGRLHDQMTMLRLGG